MGESPPKVSINPLHHGPPPWLCLGVTLESSFKNVYAWVLCPKILVLVWDMTWPLRIFKKLSDALSMPARLRTIELKFT